MFSKKFFWLSFILLFIISSYLSFVFDPLIQIGAPCDSSTGLGMINGEKIGCPMDGTVYLREVGYPGYLEMYSGGLGSPRQVTEIKFGTLMNLIFNVAWVAAVSLLIARFVGRRQTVQIPPLQE